MSRARFFLAGELPPEIPALLPLAPADLHHATRVLRLAPGEELDVVAPSGAAWRVCVSAVSAEGISVDSVSKLPPASTPRVALFQGVAKGDKMDSIIRQAVEVGATLIVPVLTSRSVVRLDPLKARQKGDRWRRIARAAAEQARREQVPDVADPIAFEEALGLLGEHDRTVVLWEDHRGTLLSVALRQVVDGSETRIALFIGPEGGLSAEEVGELTALGADVASLGPSILRTETAAIVAVGLAVAAVLEAGEPRGR